MPDDLSVRVFRARLNYQDVREHTDWGHVMINDYLGITEGTIAIADQIDQNTINISVNAENIEELEQLTAGHQITLYSLSSRIGANARQISENTSNISQNTSDITDNSLKIDDLEQLANRVWQ